MRIGIAVALLVAACGDDAPSGPCTDGETRACYSGPPGSEGVGTCAAGIETCAGGEFSGICVGDVTPFVDNCDGIDNDCNGVVDDATGTGNPCNNADDCDGTTACVGEAIRCVGPDRNACGVCGGVDVAGLGGTCTLENCSGELVCNEAGDATACDAPAENACGLCGGPEIANLGDDCSAASGCAGLVVCNDNANGTVCDCNPEPGMCRQLDGTFRPVVAPVAGDLVITEVMPSPSGDDNLAEWFEVEVKTAVDLNQLALDRVSDSRAPDEIQSVDCLRVAPGDRLIFAKRTDPADNGNLPFVTATFGFSMIAGSVAEPGDVRLLVEGTLVDALTWTDSSTNTALQLDLGTLDHLANDSETNLCDATAPYNNGADLGTPGAENRVCPPLAGECLGANGFRRAIDAPVAGELVITEVMPGPSGDDNLQEWFEVEATAAVDLNNLQLDRASDSSAPSTITSPTCIPVAAGTRLLFAKNADPLLNGGLPAVDGLFTFSMLAGSAASPGDVRIAFGGTTIDAISWTGSAAARSRQLDPDATTATANDDELNFCDATAAYSGTDFGTPKLANLQCPPRPGECTGATGDRPILKPAVGQLVITEYFANPFGADTDDEQEWFEILNVGPGAVDLNDLGLKGNATTINLIDADACLTLPQDGFALFAHSTDPAVNGGLPAVDATFTFAIAASNGSLSVLDGALVIDQTTWTTPAVPDGLSRQLDPATLTSIANDTQNSFCDAAGAAQIYGSVAENLGTPRVQNSCP
jgi:hypothetical protein